MGGRHLYMDHLTAVVTCTGLLASLVYCLCLQVTERVKYDKIFDGLQPVGGFLTGDKVKPVSKFTHILKSHDSVLFLYFYFVQGLNQQSGNN